jgi:alpha-glucosidase (family GH31 glycosyl hydrolase)
MIPTMPPRNYVGEQPGDPITFNIYPDDKGLASGKLYEDDGNSPAYKQGMFRRTSVSARPDGRGFVVSVDATQGQYNPGQRKLNFVVAGSTAAVRTKT